MLRCARCASRAGSLAVTRLCSAPPRTQPPPAAPLAAAARRISRMAAPAAAALPAAAQEASAPVSPPPAPAAPKPAKTHRGLTSLTVGGLELDAVSIGALRSAATPLRHHKKDMPAHRACCAPAGGQETCICVPSLKIAFDIGRCPQRAVNMEHLFLSHCHLGACPAKGYLVCAERATGGASAPCAGALLVLTRYPFLCPQTTHSAAFSALFLSLLARSARSCASASLACTACCRTSQAV